MLSRCSSPILSPLAMKPFQEKEPSLSSEVEIINFAPYSNPVSVDSSHGSETESADEDECLKFFSDEEDCSKKKIISQFIDVDATPVSVQQSSLHYDSDSDTDIEEAILDFSTLDQNVMDSSSDEYFDGFEDDDPLRHAEVYTEEEMVALARNKMDRLKTLFIDQVKRLQYILQRKRHSYLQSLKKEKEIYGSIHSQIRKSPAEEKLYQKLKALNSYHKRNGVEAVLRKKSLEKRSKTVNGRKGCSGNKCIYTEEDVRCGAKVLPLSKYCLKHILEDQNQALFRVCNSQCADLPCREPISVFLENSYCVFHNRHMPPLPHLTLNGVEKKES
ncbi:KAT8 regulatory NSL complex subunit 2 isoform X1 [Bemisia tabaci]|uniref:KAT8 regulatory NSL complex subunit 2 isoform X1 n=2 Tax=Bemisia tabaci TaxID=7038 RepID=UPI003B281FDA